MLERSHVSLAQEHLSLLSPLWIPQLWASELIMSKLRKLKIVVGIFRHTIIPSPTTIVITLDTDMERAK